MTIFEQLFKAGQTVGLAEQAPGQSDQEYLESLLKAVSELSDVEWNKLSDAAQEWYNKTAGFVNQDPNETRVIPRPEGFREPSPETVAQEQEAASKKKATETKKNPFKKKAVSEDAAKPVKEARKPGLMMDVRRTTMLHPDWTNNQVYDEIIKTWPNALRETVAVNAGDTRLAIRVARELGFWNDANYEKINQGNQDQAAAPTPTHDGNQQPEQHNTEETDSDVKAPAA